MPYVKNALYLREILEPLIELVSQEKRGYMYSLAQIEKEGTCSL